ncbi:MAG: biotin--[acetyl-CoA-carboxylase] ligase [Longimicrobiales bacterium]
MTRRADWEGLSESAWHERLGVTTAEFYTEIDSTMVRARAIASDPSVVLPALVVADRQTAATGRMGRPWVSDSDLGLWCTVILDAEAGVDVLPLLAGLAICCAAESESEAAGLELGIKWPNDVVTADGKVAGVLCVRIGNRVLVGVGINVNHGDGDLPAGAGIQAASLRTLTGRPFDRGALLSRLLTELLELWPAGVSSPAGPGLDRSTLARINERSVLRGRPLAATGTVRHSSGQVEAQEETRGLGGEILADGGLQILLPEGGVTVLIAGSVRASS